MVSSLFGVWGICMLTGFQMTSGNKQMIDQHDMLLLLCTVVKLQMCNSSCNIPYSQRQHRRTSTGVVHNTNYGYFVYQWYIKDSNP